MEILAVRYDSAAAALRKIEKGAALLNEKKPHWYDDIDLGSLELADDTACVLGQLFGAYEDGVKYLFTEPLFTERELCAVSAEHGFDTDGVVSYMVLTALWTELIDALQSARERDWELQPV